MGGFSLVASHGFLSTCASAFSFVFCGLRVSFRVFRLAFSAGVWYRFGMVAVRLLVWFCYRFGCWRAGSRAAFVLSASGFWFRAWRFFLRFLPTPLVASRPRRLRSVRVPCSVCSARRARLGRPVGCRACGSRGFVFGWF